MESRNIKRVGIVGAGVAGLATAKTLQAAGYDCTIFERAERLGGVWADGYSNFGVQVQRELYQFPDWPLPADTPNFGRPRYASWRAPRAVRATLARLGVFHKHLRSRQTRLWSTAYKAVERTLSDRKDYPTVWHTEAWTLG